ncbi:hypothetical protein IPM62_00910 [Candidatus Woesebacteria bacterium]|nr:MAG: hypothetical protein IPM62_00910 [Candidatus Woesebacteria bacterium]
MKNMFTSFMHSGVKSPWLFQGWGKTPKRVKLLFRKENDGFSAERELEIITQKAKSGKVKIMRKHRIPRSRLLTLASILVLIVCISVIVFCEFQKNKSEIIVTNFDECVNQKGSIIRETYPETCVTKNNLIFTRIITDEIDNSDYKPDSLINQDSPDSKIINCGGRTNYPCPEGFTCVIVDNQPDAGGTCIKNN